MKHDYDKLNEELKTCSPDLRAWFNRMALAVSVYDDALIDIMSKAKDTLDKVAD